MKKKRCGTGMGNTCPLPPHLLKNCVESGIYLAMGPPATGCLFQTRKWQLMIIQVTQHLHFLMNILRRYMIVDTSAKMILSATISNQINLHPPINLGVILMCSVLHIEKYKILAGYYITTYSWQLIPLISFHLRKKRPNLGVLITLTYKTGVNVTCKIL